MDILDFLEDATKEADSFEHHPIKDFSLEDQLLYLQGLAIVMNADGAVHEDEKEYLRILIKSFGMDESSLESLVEFANRPDKDTIQAFFRTYRRKPIAQLFLFDALMMTRRDDEVHDKEIAVVNKMADQLEILKGTQKDIYDLFCFIKNKNWEESALYFSSHLLNPDHFKHLLDYHGLDMDEVLASAREFRLDRLKAAIQRKVNLEQYNWEAIAYRDKRPEYDPEETEITTRFVGALITEDIYVPLVQSKLDRGELRVDGDYIYKKENNGQYLCLKDLALSYDQETLSVFLKNENEKQSSEKACDNVSFKSSRLLLDDIVSLFGQEYQAGDIKKFFNDFFGSSIAFGRDYGDGDICFPKANGKYINEIVLAHNGKLYENPKCLEYVSRSSEALDNSLLELLIHGRFRLMRKGQK